MHQAPLSFYNVVVSDGEGRMVVLDHAFDPARVEDSIDWISRGRLEKHVPQDVRGYVAEQGPTPLSEIVRVFALPGPRVLRELAQAEEDGLMERVVLAGEVFWSARREGPRAVARSEG